jgi:transcription-repair coupling factor (superfamily II helicase)
VGGDAPIDVGASAYRGLDEVLEHAASTGRPVVTLSPLVSGRDDAFAPAVHEVESYRGDTDRALTDLRAHVATGGVAVLVVAGPGTAQRAIEQLRDADVPAKLVERLAAAPEPGLVTVTCGRLTEGLVTRGPATGGGLVVLTEADVTGNRAATADPRTLGSKRRRSAVDLVTLSPGDYVVHAQHGIGRFVEMRERTVSGATQSTSCWSTARRRGPARRPAVRPDGRPGRDQPVRRWRVPTLNKLGGADWAKTRAGPQGCPGDRRAARPAVRRPPVRSRARVRPRHALAA